MKFKENQKTALAKVLSDLVQCDGIVNQGEIDFLQRVYTSFNITAASRKKAGTLTLTEAVALLKNLGKTEKNALLTLFQQLALADDSLDPTESLLITAILLSIEIELPETKGLTAHFVSIPNLNFDTHNAVLYVETAFDKSINASIQRDYEAIRDLLHSVDREFFYLPQAILDLQGIRTTFRDTLQYIDPTLTDEQLELLDRTLYQLDSAALSKEIFLNYLKTNGLTITKPSFFFKIDNLKPSLYQDFLILEIDEEPLSTLQRIIALNKGITKLKADIPNAKDQQLLHRLAYFSDETKKDELDYTGFHKIIIDILLKNNGLHENSRLFITRHGDLYLTDRNNAEVKMPTLSKALYLLFLFHEEGIALPALSDYKPELYRIYRHISTYADDTLLTQAIDNLTDFVGSTMNATLSRIKKAFTGILGDTATPYLIRGEKGGRKSIHLNRSLVVFEDRKMFG